MSRSRGSFILIFLQFEESVRKRVESELEAKIKIKTEELREASSNVDAKVQAEVATEKRRLELLVGVLISSHDPSDKHSA